MEIDPKPPTTTAGPKPRQTLHSTKPMVPLASKQSEVCQEVLDLPRGLSSATAEFYLWNLLVLRLQRKWQERELILFSLLLEKVGMEKDPSFWTMNRRVRWSIVTIISKSRGAEPPPYVQSQIELMRRNGYQLSTNPRRIFGWLNSKEWKTLVNRRKFVRKDQRPRDSRRIGVGYRDHGTYRNVATNGTPSWQDVAAAGLPDAGHNFLPPLKSPSSPWGPWEKPRRQELDR